MKSNVSPGDLTHIGWIPVQNEKQTLCSLREAFAHAHELSGISLADALEAASLLFFFSTIAQDMHQPRSRADIAALLQGGRFDEDLVENYFDRLADRFDLFHPEHPFAQAAGLELTSGDVKPASALILKAPSGNNIPLFVSLTEGDDLAMTPAEAARHLLTLMAFDTAGIKSGAKNDPAVKGGKTSGNKTGISGQMGSIAIVGRNLFETIVLNMAPFTPTEEDQPIWMKDLTPVWRIRQPAGPLEHLTWASRRIRLFPNEDRTRVVGGVICAGDRMEFINPEFEHRCRWRTVDEKTGEKRPVRWRPGQPAWRQLRSVLMLDAGQDMQTSRSLLQLSELSDVLGEDYPARLLCVGVEYGSMSAVISDTIIDAMPLPLTALRASDSDVRDALTTVVSEADSLRRALDRLENDIRKACGADDKEWNVGTHPGDLAMEDLDASTRRLLAGLQREPEKYYDGIDAWRKTARAVVWKYANRLLDTAPPHAIKGNANMRLANAERYFRRSLRKINETYTFAKKG